MTTNKPDVVAWRWRKPVVNDQGETIGVTAWKLSDEPGFLPWWTNEPLIRLSDYEALQAENERLRKDAARYRWLRTRWGRIADAYDGDSDQLVAIREADSHFEGWDVDPASLDRAIDAAMQRTSDGGAE